MVPSLGLTFFATYLLSVGPFSWSQEYFRIASGIVISVRERHIGAWLSLDSPPPGLVWQIIGDTPWIIGFGFLSQLRIIGFVLCHSPITFNDTRVGAWRGEWNHLRSYQIFDSWKLKSMLHYFPVPWDNTIHFHIFNFRKTFNQQWICHWNLFSNICMNTNKAEHFYDLMARERIRPHLCILLCNPLLWETRLPNYVQILCCN